MRWFVDLASRLVQKVPVVVLGVLLVATVVLGSLASQQQVETDITEFAPEGELADVFDRIDEQFGGREGQIQVIVDAGPGGDVLQRDGLAAAQRVADIAEDTPGIAEALREEGPLGGAVSSFASPVTGQLDAFDADLDSVGEGFLDAVVDDVMSGEQGAQLEGLLSNDFDGERARGGLVMVGLDPDLSLDETEAASVALAEALSAEDFGFLDVDAFSFAILAEDLEAGFEEELPLLLGISFLLIMGILGVLYRRVSDVLLAVTGLVVSIVWMAGFSVLLGPDYLGITGPFNQIAIAVPVLLVGLGVDYSVHLSSRYREERGAGKVPPEAARIAVATVGVALLLATVTTVIGFLSNAISPLPPIADFGWFAAAGILSSFVVLGGLVPAARNLLDRRRRAASAAPPPATSGGPVVTRLAEVPARVPMLALGVGFVVAAGAGLLATNLDTTFSQDEFIPEDSDAGQLLDQLDELFGGDVSEQTFVLLEGDVDVEALQAIHDAEEGLAGVEDVVTVDDRADVQSPPQVIRSLDETVDALRQQLAGQFALLDDPAAAAETLPLPDRIAIDDLPADMRAELSDGNALDDGEGLPLAGADALPTDLDALEERLPDGVSPFEALLAALPEAQLVDAFRSGLAEQLEEGVPDVDDAVIADLAALEPEELTAEAIIESGYPTDELPDDALALLEAGDRLEELGWTDDGFAADADVDALLDVVDEHSGDELNAVLGDDAALMIVSTRAGEEGAPRLADDLRDGLSGLTAMGLEPTVVSEQLLIDETLNELADSQTDAIIVSLAAALALVTVYYGFTARRPALGLITMIPALLSVPLILGSMWVAGLSFNALTATVASIAIGIGVPYGIHLTNRYLEQRERGGDPAETIRQTIHHTGAALFGSAITTASGFGVLVLSNLVPIRQFGGVTSVTILYALITAILLESSALVLWDRHHRRNGRGPQQAASTTEAAPPSEPAPERQDEPEEAPALLRARVGPSYRMPER